MATDIAKLEIRVDSLEVKLADQRISKMGNTSTSAARKAKLLAAGIAAIVTGAGIRRVIQLTDEFNQLNNQLRQLTNSEEELIKTRSQLLDLSNETRADLDSTTTLYARLTRATSEMGLSQERLLGITGTINKAFAVEGASAQEAAGAIRQLSQGLASGALRGDEFNSIAEGAPAIMTALATSLQMTRGELREFAATGGITAQIVVDALEASADVIDDRFATTVRTFDQSVTIARNNMLEFIGSAGEVQKAVGSLGDALIFLSESVDDVAEFFNVIGWLGEATAARIYGAAVGDLPRLFDELTEAQRVLDHTTTFFGTKRKEEAQAEVDRIQALIDLTYELDAARRRANQTQAEELLILDEKRQFENSASTYDFEDLQAEVEAGRLRMIADRHADQLIAENDFTGMLVDVERARLEMIAEMDEEHFKEISIFADEAARNMQTAFADFLFNPFEEGLGGMVRGFGEAIQRMLAEQAAAGIMDMLGGLGGGKKGKGGGGGNIFGSIAGLFGFADGGSFKVGGDGGTDSQLVAFKASPNETVSVTKPGQSSGPSGVHIGQMVFPGVKDKKTAQEAASTMGRELNSIVASAARYQ